MVTDETNKVVKSADRALQILELLASSTNRPTLSEISRQLNIPLSSVHGLLQTMRRRMWIEVDATNTRFGIGVQALVVGSSYARTDDVLAHAEPVLDLLSRQTGETVHYGRLEGSYVVYLAKRESRYPLRIYSAIGRRVPAHASALGKAILAQYDNAEVKRMLSWPLPALTAHTLTTAPRLMRDLATVRRLDYARETEECDDGLGCIAISVPGAQARDAISLAVPTARLAEDRARELTQLLLAAREMLHDRLPAGLEPGEHGFLRTLEKP